MRLAITIYCIVVTLLSHDTVLSQELKVPEIFKQSGAELVFIGKVDSYMRGYSRGGKNDNTEVHFAITKVLKGDYQEKYISIRLHGHIGFGKESSIVFVTSDIMKVNEFGELPECREEKCYYTLLDWMIPNTKRNIDSVRKIQQNLTLKE